MRMHQLIRKQVLPLTPREIFSFFESPENLSLITPPWLGFRILTPSPVTMKVGTLIDYTIKWIGIPVRWTTLITTYEPPSSFVDEQIRGPYALWHHTHAFRETEEGVTEMTDTVHYMLPYGWLGDVAHALVVRRQLEEIFTYRMEAVAATFSTGGRPRRAQAKEIVR
jgi:ligand-binding SRPBCC domain-containing protein